MSTDSYILVDTALFLLYYLARKVIVLLKDNVLCILEQHKGDVVTGGRLASELGVSRNAIWKTIRLLQDDGNDIVSVPNKGYRLLGTNDTLFEKFIRDGLMTSFIGQDMRILPSVHSTNQYLKELDADTVDSGFVLIADEQTGGRGRRGRVFVSRKGEGVYFSILLKLGRTQQDIRLLTVCAAVAVSRAIEDVCGIRADIKWVNDVFCDGKKVCGILTEAVVSGELQELSTVIVGIGINTGMAPPEFSDIATSVQEAAGVCGLRNRLIAGVLNQFEAVYLDYTERGNGAGVIEYYRSRLFIIGRQVLVSDVNSSYVATVQGVDDMGALIVMDDGGVVRFVSSGEIKLKW